MNTTDRLSNTTSKRRNYQRFHRKRNGTRTRTKTLLTTPIPLSGVLLNTSNLTTITNGSSVQINDLFAPISYLSDYKYFFLAGLIILILLCLITVGFLIYILRCCSKKRLDKKRNNHHELVKKDFLDGTKPHADDHLSLLNQEESNPDKHHCATSRSSAGFAMETTSNTASIDQVVVQKILQNNPPNSHITSTNQVDNTSVDTLRGSLGSSRSERNLIPQVIDSSIIANPVSEQLADESSGQPKNKEKDDDLVDLEFEKVRPRFVKGIYSTSNSNLSGHRTSASNIDQSIRRREQNAEREERGQLHGSNSNLYEKELKKRAEQSLNRHPTKSEISLVSRTSEDSCY